MSKLEKRAVKAYVAEVRGKKIGKRYDGPSPYEILDELPYKSTREVKVWHDTAVRVIEGGKRKLAEGPEFRCVICGEPVGRTFNRQWVHRGRCAEQAGAC